MMNSLLSQSCRMAGRSLVRLNRLIPACTSVYPVRFNHYKTLNVKRNASQREIDEAFDGLTRKYQRKVKTSRDAREKFDEISYAYYVLSEHDSRRDYDRLLGPCSDPDEYPGHDIHPSFKFAHDLRFGRDRFDRDFSEKLRKEDEQIMELRRKLAPWVITALALVTFILMKSILTDSHLSKPKDVDHVAYLKRLEMLQKEGTFTTSVTSSPSDTGLKKSNDLVEREVIPEWKPK